MKTVTPAAAAAALLLLAPTAVLACSICRCGDPTFNALGKEGYHASGIRLALDWERFDKQEGDPALESESQVENRWTALVSYGFGERFMLTARVPLSVRQLDVSAAEDGETVRTTGISDPEIYGQARLWASRLSGLGRRASLSLIVGVKAPWGQNDVRQDGERVDEHAQPGTGSTDVFGSLAFLYLIDKDSALFASSGYRHTGANDSGYRYGSAFLANVAYEHRLGGPLDGVVELNFRHARQDEAGSARTLGEDTGGSLLYLTPRLLASLGHGVVLRAGAQIPVWKDLHGYQKERVVANVGITYLFGR